MATKLRRTIALKIDIAYLKTYCRHNASKRDASNALNAMESRGRRIACSAFLAQSAFHLAKPGLTLKYAAKEHNCKSEFTKFDS